MAGRRVTAILFLAQRLTAFVLALAVAVHLGTILYAVRGGLTAAEILGRTHGNIAFLLFYAVFVIAVAAHAPIGLRNIFREWTRWRGLTLDLALALFAILLLGLGLRAVFAVFAS
jgi:fumarate reductase subunit C